MIIEVALYTVGIVTLAAVCAPFAAAIVFDMMLANLRDMDSLGFFALFLPPVMVWCGYNPWKPSDWFRMWEKEKEIATTRTAVEVAETGVRWGEGDDR